MHARNINYNSSIKGLLEYFQFRNIALFSVYTKLLILGGFDLFWLLCSMQFILIGH